MLIACGVHCSDDLNTYYNYLLLRGNFSREFILESFNKGSYNDSYLWDINGIEMDRNRLVEKESVYIVMGV